MKREQLNRSVIDARRILIYILNARVNIYLLSIENWNGVFGTEKILLLTDFMEIGI